MAESVPISGPDRGDRWSRRRLVRAGAVRHRAGERGTGDRRAGARAGSTAAWTWLRRGRTGALRGVGAALRGPVGGWLPALRTCDHGHHGHHGHGAAGLIQPGAGHHQFNTPHRRCPSVSICRSTRVAVSAASARVAALGGRHLSAPDDLLPLAAVEGGGSRRTGSGGAPCKPGSGR